MAIYIQRSEFITLLGGAPPAAMAAAAAVPLKKLEGSGQNDVFMP
jgi:hypothetical protein